MPHDLPVLQHVAAVGGAHRVVDVLLDEQDRRAVLGFEFADDLERNALRRVPHRNESGGSGPYAALDEQRILEHQPTLGAIVRQRAQQRPQ